MLKVYIIDDDDKQRQKLTDIVNDIAIKDDIDIKIEISTTKVKEFIHILQDNRDRGIYLLDLDLADEINGVELAGLIKKYDLNSNIIFISTHGEFCDLTFEYKLESLAFIEKGDYDQIQDKLRECFQTVIKSRKRNLNTYLNLQSGERAVALVKDEVCFIEYIKKSKKYLVHSENRHIEVNSNIKELNQQLGDEFLIVNRNLYVNLMNIDKISIDGKTLIMKNGEKCSVGKKIVSKIKREEIIK